MASRPIQGYPLGFLSLLGLKNLGKLPDSLPDQVDPTIELGGYYLRGIREMVVAPAFINATGGYQVQIIMATPVPDGEVWFVHSLGVQMQAAAPPAAGTWWGSIRISDATNNVRWGKSQDFTGQGAAGLSELFLNFEGQWMYPGDFLSAAWVMAAGDFAAISGLYVSRLKI